MVLWELVSGDQHVILANEDTVAFIAVQNLLQGK